MENQLQYYLEMKDNNTNEFLMSMSKKLGENLVSCDQLCIVGGELAGKVKINNSEFPFIGNKVIKQIDGFEIKDAGDIQVIDGKLAGRVEIIEDIKLGFAEVKRSPGMNPNKLVIGEIRYPFIGDKIIRDINGHKIEGCGFIGSIENKLVARIKILKKRHILIGDQFVETIDGHKIDDCTYMTTINGEIHGIVIINKKEYKFINNRIINK